MIRFTVAVICVAVASIAGARDLNRQNYLIGERASGMGGAFVSLTGDATSAYYNPAGLGGLYRKGISLSASAYQASIEKYPKLLNIDMGDGTSLRGDMDSSTFATFPSSIAYVMPFGNTEEHAAPHHVLSFSVLVPDYDKLSAKISAPIGDYAFELQGSYLNTDLTYWVGPSYAVQLGGNLRLGLSLFALAYTSETQMKIAEKMTDATNVNSYITYSLDVSGTSLSMLAQAGVQYDFSDNFTAGFTVRTPTFGRLWSSVSMLQLNNYYAEDEFGVPQPGGYADRIEVKDGVALERRLPLMLAIGANYHVPRRFAIALDATLHLAQSSYRQFDGPLAYPRDPSGNPILDDARAIDPVVEAKANQVVNANLGVEVNLSEKMLGRFGLFTDFSAVDKEFNPQPTMPELTRFGISLGVGRTGEKSTTSLGVVYAMGRGTAPGLNGAFELPANEVKVTAHTVTAVVSGSADL